MAPLPGCRNRFPHVADLATYISNISAVVGVHGGALNNVWWAARNTMLLEFMPTTRPMVIFWQEGLVVGLRYFVIPCAITSCRP